MTYRNYLYNAIYNADNAQNHSIHYHFVNAGYKIMFMADGSLHVFKDFDADIEKPLFVCTKKKDAVQWIRTHGDHVIHRQEVRQRRIQEAIELLQANGYKVTKEGE